MVRTRASKLILAALLAANAVVWIIPSNVVELVARDHQTLLGRYSFPHFLWNVALLVATVIAFYIAGAPRNHRSETDATRDQRFKISATRVRRVRAFRVVAMLVSILLSAVL